jgi:hypothetical protein
MHLARDNAVSTVFGSKTCLFPLVLSPNTLTIETVMRINAHAIVLIDIPSIFDRLLAPQATAT